MKSFTIGFSPIAFNDVVHAIQYYEKQQSING